MQVTISDYVPIFKYAIRIHTIYVYFKYNVLLNPVKMHATD